MESRRDIDKIIPLIEEKFPLVRVWQSQVKYPSDDDGIWYFWLPENPKDDIQIENSYGKCPFIIETNRSPEVRHGETIEQVVSIVCEHLKTSLNQNE